MFAAFSCDASAAASKTPVQVDTKAAATDCSDFDEATCGDQPGCTLCSLEASVMDVSICMPDIAAQFLPSSELQ
jgi:hypothetical protein